MMSIIKNPIVLGVLAGGLTYIYFVWSNKNKKEKDQKDISLITPIVVAIAVCLVAYLYFGTGATLSNDTVTEITKKIPINQQVTPDVKVPSAKLVSQVSESAESFHLITKGINIPNNVPDVFIETY